MRDEYEPGAPPQIEPQGLDDYLEAMSKCVFQSGMSWQVVHNKWETTREAFHDFAIETVAGLGPDDVDDLVKDTRVIRNRRKLDAVVSNAERLIELDGEHGGFRNYLRSHDDFEATVKALKRDFKFLGNTGSYVFLYVVGEQVPPHDEWEASKR